MLSKLNLAHKDIFILICRNIRHLAFQKSTISPRSGEAAKTKQKPTEPNTKSRVKIFTNPDFKSFCSDQIAWSRFFWWKETKQHYFRHLVYSSCLQIQGWKNIYSLHPWRFFFCNFLLYCNTKSTAFTNPFFYTMVMIEYCSILGVWSGVVFRAFIYLEFGTFAQTFLSTAVQLHALHNCISNVTLY